jgi:hypothetical protein
VAVEKTSRLGPWCWSASSRTGTGAGRSSRPSCGSSTGRSTGGTWSPRPRSEPESPNGRSSWSGTRERARQVLRKFLEGRLRFEAPPERKWLVVIGDVNLAPILAEVGGGTKAMVSPTGHVRWWQGR